MALDARHPPVSRFKQLVDQLCEEHERELLSATSLREEVEKLQKEVEQLHCNGVHSQCDDCTSSDASYGVEISAEERSAAVLCERVPVDGGIAVVTDNTPVHDEAGIETVKQSSKCFWQDTADSPAAMDDERPNAASGGERLLAIEDNAIQDSTFRINDSALRKSIGRGNTTDTLSSAHSKVTSFSLYGGDEPETVASSSSLGEASVAAARQAAYRASRSQTEELVAAGEFVPRPIWKRKMSKRKATSVGHMHNTPERKSQTQSLQTLLPDQVGVLRFMYTQPSSWTRVCWDTFGLISLVCDLVMVPLQAFDMPRFSSAETLDWITRVFWTVDIPASFFVGFFHQGDLVMSPRRIIRRYLMTWFIPDVTIVGCDWILWWLAFESGEHSGSYVRMARVARTARLVRLFRVFKMRRLMQGFEDLIDTEKIHICLACMKPIVLIMAFNHFLACAWFAVGNAGNPGWTETFFGDTYSDIGYQYLTSLHWSLSQFTVGNMDVQAVNANERLFTVIVMVTGLSSFSSLCGSVTSAVERLRELRSDENRQFWLLRRYLRDYKISKNLMSRIHRYCDYAYKHRQSRMQSQRVTLLELLSDQLHWELQSEIHTPHLKHHPLFDKIVNLPCQNHLDRVCAQALFSLEVARMEGLFHAGDPCTQMLFIVDGECIYIKAVAVEYGDVQTAPNPYQLATGAYTTNTAIGVGDWACEQVLYTPWVHLGELRAAHESRLLALDANHFCEVMASSNPMAWELCRKYAAHFIEFLNQLGSQDLTDLMQAMISPCQVLEAQEQEDIEEAGRFSSSSEIDDANHGIMSWSGMGQGFGRIFSRRPSLGSGSNASAQRA